MFSALLGVAVEAAIGTQVELSSNAVPLVLVALGTN